MTVKTLINTQKTDLKSSTSISRNQQTVTIKPFFITRYERIMHLQRTVGNQAVQRMVQSGILQAFLTRPTNVRLSNSSIERSSSDYDTLQRQQLDKNEELQTKQIRESLQREMIGAEEEEVLQTKSETQMQSEKEESIQTKLTISKPNDKYEQEADRIADQVMSMPAPTVQKRVVSEEDEERVQTRPLVNYKTTLIQRQVEDEEKPVQTKLQRQEMSEEEEEIQTKDADNGVTTIISGLESRFNTLMGSGKPLPESERQFFEPRFGVDFSNVRIHMDTNAVDLARLIQAKAFTKGNNIVFGKGWYAPGKKEGRWLLGHELVHVIQQKGFTEDSINLSTSFQKTVKNRDVIPIINPIEGVCIQRDVDVRYLRRLSILNEQGLQSELSRLEDRLRLTNAGSVEWTDLIDRQRAVLDELELRNQGLERDMYTHCRREVFGDRTRLSYGGKRIPPNYQTHLILQVAGTGTSGYGPEDLAAIWALEQNFLLRPRNHLNDNGTIDIGPAQLNSSWHPAELVRRGIVVGPPDAILGTRRRAGQVFNGDPQANLEYAWRLLQVCGHGEYNPGSRTRLSAVSRLLDELRPFFRCMSITGRF